MKRGYLYLVFISLALFVVLGILLAYKLTGTTEMLNSDDLISDKGSHPIVMVDNYQESWISKLSSKQNQKEYLYPVEKLHIEFN